MKKGFCDRNSSGGFSGFCKGFWKQIDADFKTNKDFIIIPPGQIPTSVLLWGLWCGGTHPAPALPHSPQQQKHFPQQYKHFQGAAADPVANSTASLWHLNPAPFPRISTPSSAREGSSLMLPALTAPGGISSAELTATGLSGDRRETISFTYYQGLHTWLKK